MLLCARAISEKTILKHESEAHDVLYYIKKNRPLVITTRVSPHVTGQEGLVSTEKDTTR